MQELARAVLRRDTLKRHIQILEKDIAGQQARLFRADTLAAAERWLAQNYMSALKEDLGETRRNLKDAEDIVDECRVTLVERAKERGLLDSLKEKQAARHLLLDRQQERRTNYETATLRYKAAAF